MVDVLSRKLAGVAGAFAAAAVVTAPLAHTQPPSPPPPPPAPNVNAFGLAKPSEYAVMNGTWYAFTTPDGLTCVIDRGTGGYGCNGPIPAAPDGANTVSGGTGAPAFSSTPIVNFGITDPIKPLPAKTRVSYRQVSCGHDAGTTTCMNSFDQTGFVLTPAGSYIVGADTPPLLQRPEGTRPY